jgi:hypothetical protein
MQYHRDLLHITFSIHLTDHKTIVAAAHLVSKDKDYRDLKILRRLLKRGLFYFSHEGAKAQRMQLRRAS